MTNTINKINIKEFAKCNEGWLRVASTCISQVKHWDEKEILLIRFQNNLHYYPYYNVNKQMFNSFLDSDSKGKFFNTELKNNPQHDIRLNNKFK